MIALPAVIDCNNAYPRQLFAFTDITNTLKAVVCSIGFLNFL
nr:MAG TPA: hypothetical protein [Caudoviricetes sp.]